jgi:hypothetical protein
MHTIDPTPQKRRRKIRDIVTWEAMNIEHKKLKENFLHEQMVFPSPQSAADVAHRRKIVENTCLVTGVAALTYLRERDPSAYSSIVRSSRHYMGILIKKGQAEFSIQPKRPSDGFLMRLYNVQVMAGYRRLMQKLQPLFRVRPTVPQHLLPTGARVVSKMGRYGEAQQIGFIRRQLQIDAIATELCKVGTELVGQQFMEARGITSKLARRWSREYRTASELSRKVLSHIAQKKPRQIKAIINLCRKQDKDAAKHARLLKKRGFRAVSTTSKGGTSVMYQPTTGLVQLIPRAVGSRKVG